MRRPSRVLGLAVAGLMIAAAAWFLLGRGESVDSRFSGAYLLGDSRLVIITPRDGSTLRYRQMDGRSAALYPAGPGRFEAGRGWSEAEPVEVTVEFEPSGDPPAGLRWQTDSGTLVGRRLDLPERFATFQSGELDLRAKLVLPAGDGPFPAVVFVHGSGTESAVDTYYNPYLSAAHGVAGLAYDKRGTGGSEGEYNQNFYLLSDDVAAAVTWLRAQPQIDADNIHLAGYSQGGWIAPLAATKTRVESLLVAYGPMVPITGEDRWGYVYALEQAGFGPAAIREVDALNAIAGDILDHRQDRWAELGEALEAAREAPWSSAVAGSDSMVGFLLDSSMPLWVMRLYAWWLTRGDVPFVDRLYDPVPTVRSLDVPSLWLFGGEDSSMPSGWSVEELERLRASGRPVEFEIWPEAEHGILLFDDTGGERRYLGYAPGYLAAQVEWLRRQSGLEGVLAPL